MGSLLQKGFTLVELLIVIVIIGVLSSIALPAFLSNRDKAEIAKAEAEAKALANKCVADVIAGETSLPTGCTANLVTAGGNFSHTSGTKTATVAIGAGGSLGAITVN